MITFREAKKKQKMAFKKSFKARRRERKKDETETFSLQLPTRSSLLNTSFPSGFLLHLPLSRPEEEDERLLSRFLLYRGLIKN